MIYQWYEVWMLNNCIMVILIVDGWLRPLYIHLYHCSSVQNPFVIPLNPGWSIDVNRYLNPQHLGPVKGNPNIPVVFKPLLGDLNPQCMKAGLWFHPIQKIVVYWDDELPKIWKSIKMFQTTNQWINTGWSKGFPFGVVWIPNTWMVVWSTN